MAGDADGEMVDDDHCDDTFRILVATDCHLGYAEKDPVRGMDSFVAFEEILSLAEEHNVDFILFGGDLFHENKPSRYCLFRCIELLRKYTLGNRPVQFEMLNTRNVNDVPDAEDDQICDENGDMSVNYEDPNLNVSFPVFSIHGNHDDPAGHGRLSSMDLLAATGLVNHFGKCLNMERVTVTPLLMQKGCTKLALFGLGSVRDERLHRIFRENRVTMVRPKEDTNEWFNVFVVHQNRAKHSATSYLPESFIDEFLDLIIWGHEHECRITPEKNHEKGFFVSQPGSSVATSLSMGEAVKKHVGILHVYQQSFKMKAIALKTVRPFVFDDVSLKDSSVDTKAANVSEYCDAVVEELIERSVSQISGDKRQPQLPLIRLRVEYERDEETFSINRFGQKYLKRVANPKDIILFQRKRHECNKIGKNGTFQGDGFKVSRGSWSNEADLIRFSAVDLVQKYFENADQCQQLEMLTENGLGKAVKEFVDKEEREAIGELVKHQVSKTQKHLGVQEVDDDNIEEHIIKFKEERQMKVAEEESETNEAFRLAKQKRIANSGLDGSRDGFGDDGTEEENDFGEPSSTPARGRGRGSRGRARATRGTRGRGRGAQSTEPTSSATKRATPKRPASTRGRQPKASVAVEDTIEKAFQSTRSSTRSTRTSKRYIDDDDDDEDDDPIVISESDEEPPKTKKRKVTSTRNTTSQRKGLVFDGDDDDDDDDALF